MTPAGLRVLLVIPGEAHGSSMIFARRQGAALAARGMGVESFYLRSRTSPWALLAEARRFRRLLRRLRPSLVHAHFGTMTALFTVLAAYPTPVMITYRGSDLNHVPTSSGPRAWLGRLLSQVAALGAHRIICVSGKLRDQLWWRRQRVSILPSGVDSTAFRPQPRDEVRRQLGWPAEVPVVLFNAGHDHYNKRLDLAQSAFERVQSECPLAQLKVLAGDVPPEQIPSWMNAADCLLVTSDAEGSPTVVQEALATNLPVVSVDVGDVVERLRGVSATAILPRDPDLLGAAVAEVLRRGVRSDGRLRIREIDASHIADELAHLYLETAARPASRTISRWNTTLFSQR